jgi:hypothetical protein
MPQGCFVCGISDRTLSTQAALGASINTASLVDDKRILAGTESGLVLLALSDIDDRNRAPKRSNDPAA